ncbi:MAG: rhomboid family intramembrane serine protease [Hydrogenothermaceae bacterium]
MIPIKDNIPTRSFPILTAILICINTGVFLYELSLPEDQLQLFVYSFGLLPTDIVEFNLLPIFTHMFLHGDVGHILGNMLFLWVFGNNVEDTLGKVKFLTFYILSGLGSAFLQSSVSLIMGDLNTPMVGASGAISGILAGYMRLFPFAKVLAVIPPFIFFIFTLPAWFFIGYWFLIQVLSAMFIPVTLGGVAWYAHIGGFLTGWYGLNLFVKKRLKF